MLPWPPP